MFFCILVQIDWCFPISLWIRRFMDGWMECPVWRTDARRCQGQPDVAGVSCNCTLSFRSVDNPTGTLMRREWDASMSASPVLCGFYNPNQM